jgi:ketosteroid isomerase-like protein
MSQKILGNSFLLVLLFAEVCLAAAPQTFGSKGEQDLKRPMATRPPFSRSQQTQRVPDKDEKEVKQVYEQIKEAIKRKDGNVLNRLLSEDFVITSKLGNRWGKSEFITAITASLGEEVEVNIKDMVVRIHGCVAILTTNEIIRGLFIHTGIKNLTRGTSVFIREKGRWKVVSMQFTMVVEVGN